VVGSGRLDQRSGSVSIGAGDGSSSSGRKRVTRTSTPSADRLRRRLDTRRRAQCDRGVVRVTRSWSLDLSRWSSSLGRRHRSRHTPRYRATTAAITGPTPTIHSRIAVPVSLAASTSHSLAADPDAVSLDGKRSVHSTDIVAPHARGRRSKPGALGWSARRFQPPLLRQLLVRARHGRAARPKGERWPGYC
jgi:hypothetical protein